MPLPPDSRDELRGLARGKMVEIDLSRRQALMAKLFLDVEKRDALLVETDGAGVAEPVYMHSLIDASLRRLAGDQPSDIGIGESIALVRAEQIARKWSAINPRNQVSVEKYARDTGYPSLAALSSTYGYRAGGPVDVTWSEIKRLVAAELGIEVDGD